MAIAPGHRVVGRTRARGFAIAPRSDRNVLLITIDTLRADALRPYGGRASTPHLDALAARGARFTFAHAHAVVTLPSHASILTGTTPTSTASATTTAIASRRRRPTLATRLKAHGFATGAFVGGFPLDQRFGLNAGFDVYDDRIGETGSTVDFALPERRADAVVASALEWIGAQPASGSRWVHVFDPHAPYQPPADSRAATPATLTPARSRGPTTRSARSSIAWPRCRGRRSSSSPPITARAWASTAS